ncbi:MAG TPA: BON domain-containing protein [Polyangiales bacterium]|nr:BON domain-containing protein [Polyangiales bacterium]
MGGIAVAVGLAYLFDPDNGKQRRSRLGSQCRNAASRLNERSHAIRDKMSNRYRGASARAISWYDTRKNPDRDLERRVRMELARSVPHPGSIGVIAHDDVVILHGRVVEGEHAQVLNCVRGVTGVQNVTDHLVETPVAQADRLGARIRQGFLRTRDDLAQPQWSPPARVGSAAVGLALVRFGARHRNMYGGIGALLGAGLLVRSLFNTPFREMGDRFKRQADLAVDKAEAAIDRGEREGRDMAGHARERAQAAYGS